MQQLTALSLDLIASGNRTAAEQAKQAKALNAATWVLAGATVALIGATLVAALISSGIW